MSYYLTVSIYLQLPQRAMTKSRFDGFVVVSRLDAAHVVVRPGFVGRGAPSPIA